MRIRDPKTTALIFASGKMVVTGAKSEDDSKLASRKYARIIQKLGFNAKFTDFKIQNIVGSCDIKFPIRLEGLASKHHPFSSYEPQLFPGLIYRMIKPKVVLLIFVSGKIVLTGAKVMTFSSSSSTDLALQSTSELEFGPLFCRTHALTLPFFFGLCSPRFERRFTRRSTLFIRSCASFANHNRCHSPMACYFLRVRTSTRHRFMRSTMCRDSTV